MAGAHKSFYVALFARANASCVPPKRPRTARCREDLIWRHKLGVYSNRARLVDRSATRPKRCCLGFDRNPSAPLLHAINASSALAGPLKPAMRPPPVASEAHIAGRFTADSRFVSPDSSSTVGLVSILNSFQSNKRTHNRASIGQFRLWSARREDGRDGLSGGSSLSEWRPNECVKTNKFSTDSGTRLTRGTDGHTHI